MSKYPLLDALRAARAHREAEVRKPLEDVIDEFAREKKLLEDVLRQPAIERIMDDMGRKMSPEIRRHVYKAIDEALRRDPAETVVRVPFSANDIRHLLPDDIEKRVLAYYEDWVRNRSVVEARSVPEDAVLRVRVSIPSLSVASRIQPTKLQGGRVASGLPCTGVD